MQQGLYKVEFRTIHGTGRGVIHASDGKLLGGNSAFAFIGSYDDSSDEISVVCSTVRHNDDPNYRPLFGTCGVHFASKMGQLAGNHFITLTSGLERLPELGKTVLWKGAQKVRFEMV